MLKLKWSSPFILKRNCNSLPSSSGASAALRHFRTAETDTAGGDVRDDRRAVRPGAYGEVCVAACRSF